MRKVELYLKKIILLIFILISILTFSGCAKLEMSYVIEENGTIEAAYLLALDQRVENWIDIDDLASAASEQAADNGFSISSVTQDGYVGLEANKTMKLEDLQKTDSKMLGFDILPAILSDYSWNYEPGVFQNRYQVDLKVDLKNLVEKTEFNKLPSDLQILAWDALDKITVKMNFTLPGQPNTTNADETDSVPGKNATRYSWNLKPGEAKWLRIDATLEKSNTQKQVMVGIGVLFTITVLYVIYRIGSRHKKKY